MTNNKNHQDKVYPSNIYRDNIWGYFDPILTLLVLNLAPYQNWSQPEFHHNAEIIEKFAGLWSFHCQNNRFLCSQCYENW